VRTETLSLRSRLDRFFFEPEVPYGLALIRMALPLATLGILFPRWRFAREVFSADGAIAQLSDGYGYFRMMPELPGTVVVALYGILIFALLSAAVGWCTRISLITSAILFSYFTMLDYVSTMTKYTVIVSHVLTLLALSPCGSLWSVDAWLANRKRQTVPGLGPVPHERFPVWPRRLIQLFIGVVYFGAAITKMHTPLFFTGDMLQYWMQTHINYRHPIGEYLSLYPILLVAFAYVTIVWEVMFIFLCWKSSWRTLVLGVGVVFHFMTTLTLGLLLFPVICYCTYLSFLDEEDVQQMAAWFRRQQRRYPVLRSLPRRLEALRQRLGDPAAWRAPARAAFVFSLALAAVVNVEIEHRLDPYGLRRPEGRHVLQPMAQEEVARMLAPTEPLRIADRFFAIDLGTFMVGDRLANRRSQFWHGEQLIAQCILTPPHEDMHLECKIQNESNQIIERFVTIATREMFRANFNYNVTDAVPPGQYTLVIETAGQPVMQKKFTVVSRDGTVAAN